MTSDLSDDEIDAICHGLKQNAAKVRFLQRLGLTVLRKPSGRPLVNRAHYDAVRGPPRAAAPSEEADGGWSGPNWSVRDSKYPEPKWTVNPKSHRKK